MIMGTRYTRSDISLLKRAVSSILDQTFPELELIICDAGSSGEARAYLERLTDYRVRLVRDESCLDLASKLNLCLRNSRGRFIARMDDDDWSHPDRLEKEIRFLQENEDVAYVGCNVTLMQNGEKIGERHLPERPAVEDFYFTQPYIHPALLFRREALEAVGGYCENRECVLCEDYDLLLRLYKAGYAGANRQEILFDYTVSADPKGSRRMRHRINEMLTRYRRFKDLERLPQALPYVFKPLFVGLIPGPLLGKLKQMQQNEWRS